MQATPPPLAPWGLVACLNEAPTQSWADACEQLIDVLQADRTALNPSSAVTLSAPIRRAARPRGGSTGLSLSSALHLTNPIFSDRRTMSWKLPNKQQLNRASLRGPSLPQWRRSSGPAVVHAAPSRRKSNPTSVLIALPRHLYILKDPRTPPHAALSAACTRFGSIGSCRRRLPPVS